MMMHIFLQKPERKWVGWQENNIAGIDMSGITNLEDLGKFYKENYVPKTEESSEEEDILEVRVEGEDQDSEKDGEEDTSQKKKGKRPYQGNFYEERARMKEFGKRRANSKDPDVFYGRNCDGDLIPIEEINDEIGLIVIRGEIISLEEREIKGEKKGTIVKVQITFRQNRSRSPAEVLSRVRRRRKPQHPVH